TGDHAATPALFCAVTAVIAVHACPPKSRIARPSACTPAHPPQSEPAMVRMQGGVERTATVDMISQPAPWTPPPPASRRFFTPAPFTRRPACARRNKLRKLPAAKRLRRLHELNRDRINKRHAPQQNPHHPR